MGLLSDDRDAPKAPLDQDLLLTFSHDCTPSSTPYSEAAAAVASPAMRPASSWDGGWRALLVPLELPVAAVEKHASLRLC